MLEDQDTLFCICQNAGREAPVNVRSRAYLVLANLALQLRGSEDTDDARKLIKALVLGCDKKLEDDVRARVFGALWSMAACAANLKEMWKNLDIRYALAAALALDEVETVRTTALAVLWTLTGEEVNRAGEKGIWEDEGMRAAILAAIASDQPSQNRVNGLNALRNLAMTVALQEPLWHHEEIQPQLLLSSSIGQTADVRASALNVLMQLAVNFRNAKNMVEAGVRDMLLQAGEDEQLEPDTRQSCKFAAEQMIGAEDWEFDEEPKEGEDAEATEEAEGEGAETGLAEATEGIPEPLTGPDGYAATEVPPGAGHLQAGVLERAGAAPGSAGYTG